MAATVGQGQSSWRLMALPTTASSYSTQTEDRRGDGNGDQGQPQPRDGQTSLYLGASPEVVPGRATVGMGHDQAQSSL